MPCGFVHAFPVYCLAGLPPRDHASRRVARRSRRPCRASKPMPGICGGRDTLGNDCVVTIAAEGLETERVDLGAAEPEGGYDMQAEEMAAMRPERRAWPAAFFQHLDNLQVAGESVTMDGIESRMSRSCRNPPCRSSRLASAAENSASPAAIGAAYRFAAAARVSKSSGSQISSNHQSPRGASASTASTLLVGE